MSKAAANEARATNESSPSPAATPPVAPAESADSPGEAPTAPAPPTAAEIEDLRARAAKADEHWDRLLRTTADFDNFRKRAAREKQEAIKYANESLLTKLLPVLDSFDAARAATEGAADKTAEALRTGLNLVQQQFKTALADAGVEEVNAAGQLFDPHLHEAVAQQECAETPEGQVLQQLRKGYRLRDRLLRPATVIVAKKPATPSAAPLEAASS
jgi:molecular chaperone GrpE